MKKYIGILMIVLFSMNSFSQNTSTQQLRLSLIGGISKELGTSFEQFNWGFNVGANLFFYLDDNLMLGLRAAYNRWTPDETEFLESAEGVVEGDVDGDAFVIEIVPSLRLTTNYPVSTINFFAQVGAGLFVVNTDVTVEGVSETDAFIQETFGEDSRGRFGFNVGAGLSFGSPQYISVDLYPMYNLIFLGESSTLQYLTVNLAVGIGI
jgi:opacity protein-like surface antigen